MESPSLEQKWKQIFSLPVSQMKPELKKLDFSEKTPLNQNILHIACIESNKEAINLILDVDLINGKLNFDLQDTPNKWSPIYYIIDSCDNGQPDLCELLIKNNANINISDDKGVTPLHLAAFKGQDDNVEYFLKQKANVNAVDKLGRTPLMYAIIEGQTNCVQALLDSGSDLTVADINGDSLLHYATGCKGNSLLYTTMLINKGVNDVNRQNNKGDTPLMLLVKKNAKDNVRLIHKLLSKGSDVTIMNDKGDNFYTLLGKEAMMLKGMKPLEKKKGGFSISLILFFFILPIALAFICTKIKQ